MRKSSTRAVYCPVEAALVIAGGKWSIPVLWNLMEGPKRTGQLRRKLGGVSEKVLTQTLRHLEAHGMVHREQYPEVPPHVEYSLTDKAKQLRPALQALLDWGEVYSGLYQKADAND